MAHNLKHHWSCWYKTEAGPSYQLLVYNMKYKSTKPILGKTMNIKDHGMKKLTTVDSKLTTVLWRRPRTFHRISMLSVLLQTEQEQWNAERDSEKKTQSALIRKMWLMRDRVGLGWGLGWGPWLGPGGLWPWHWHAPRLKSDKFSVIEIQKPFLIFDSFFWLIKNFIPLINRFQNSHKNKLWSLGKWDLLNTWIQNFIIFTVQKNDETISLHISILSYTNTSIFFKNNSHTISIKCLINITPNFFTFTQNTKKKRRKKNSNKTKQSTNIHE